MYTCVDCATVTVVYGDWLIPLYLFKYSSSDGDGGGGGDGVKTDYQKAYHVTKTAKEQQQPPRNTLVTFIRRI